MSVSEAFYGALNNVFIDMIPRFLMSEPIIYFVGGSLLVVSVGIFKKIIS